MLAETLESDVAGLACRGGCASCCTIRVSATAPEVLRIARHLRSPAEAADPGLVKRIADACLATQGLDEAQRMRLGARCPFVENGLCAIYALRPLACRGHASFSERACIEALAGLATDVPISAAHMTARSLVQNAMQSALRDGGFAWATYELNHALSIALREPGCENSWLAGADVFAPATISDVSLEEMAQTFDAIKALPA